MCARFWNFCRMRHGLTRPVALVKLSKGGESELEAGKRGSFRKVESRRRCSATSRPGIAVATG